VLSVAPRIRGKNDIHDKFSLYKASSEIKDGVNSAVITYERTSMLCFFFGGGGGQTPLSFFGSFEIFDYAALPWQVLRLHSPVLRSPYF
jgi:hypothetical protein